MAKKAEAVTETVIDNVDHNMDLVEIPALIFDNERYSAPVYVTVNGKTYGIPRGVSGLKVPKVVADILRQSEYQKQMASRYMTKIEGIKKMGEM